MARRRVTHRRLSSEDAARLDIDLWIGGHPWPGMTDEQALELLAEAWEVRRETLLAGRDSPGRRPACWWMLDQGRGVPQTAVGEAVALAELGELDELEVSALFARADRGTGLEADDQAVAVAAAVADTLGLSWTPEKYTHQTDKGVK